MPEPHDGKSPSSNRPPLSGANTDPHDLSKEQITSKAPDVEMTRWKERRLAAFSFALTGGPEGSDRGLAKLTQSLELARQAFAAIREQKGEFIEEHAIKVGKIVTDHRDGFEECHVTIGHLARKLLVAEKSVDAPAFDRWLEVWSDPSHRHSFSNLAGDPVEWPARFTRGIDVLLPSEKKKGSTSPRYRHGHD